MHVFDKLIYTFSQVYYVIKVKFIFLRKSYRQK